MVDPTMDMLGWLRNQIQVAEPDLLREMVQTFAEALMGAEADALCGAGYGERSPERTNRRNGSPVNAVTDGQGADRQALLLVIPPDLLELLHS